LAALRQTCINNEILWLVRLGLDQRLFTRAQAIAVRQAVGEAADLMDFAQKLIDDAIVEDLDTLEKLAGLAQAKGTKSPPADDPFDESEPEPEPEPTPAEAAGKQPAAAPKFPFDQVATLSDDALAEAMRSLLKATARYGASDLHLSTGARPFVRKHREFEYLAEKPLGPEDALRLNTVLLSEAQKGIYLERKDYDYALSLGGNDRYRVNLMFHKNVAAGSYRMVPDKVRTLEQLGYAAHLDTLKRLLSYHNGLILITGPVGSGKTTTLASMVAYLNETREDHIIMARVKDGTIEPKEAYMKGANKALFAPLLKPGDLDGGH
jgi:twitching motility protein PilT